VWVEPVITTHPVRILILHMPTPGSLQEEYRAEYGRVHTHAQPGCPTRGLPQLHPQGSSTHSDLLTALCPHPAHAAHGEHRERAVVKRAGGGGQARGHRARGGGAKECGASLRHFVRGALVAHKPASVGQQTVGAAAEQPQQTPRQRQWWRLVVPSRRHRRRLEKLGDGIPAFTLAAAVHYRRRRPAAAAV